jgi:hypothetical protein
MLSHMIKALGIFLVLLLLATTGSSEPRDSSAIVDRAIAARGGLERLQKLRRLEIAYAGTIRWSGREVRFQSTVWQDGPDRIRASYVIQTPERPLQATQILSGAAGWRIHADGTVAVMSQMEVQAFRDESHPGWLACLFPLKAADVSLSVLPDQEVDGTPCAVLKVTVKDRPTVELYFDRSTWLLVRWVCVLRGPHVGTLQEDVRLDRYAERSGLMFPTRMASFRDRNLFMEAHLEHVRLLEEVDARLFDKPASKP